jgi:hypothetical protein
MNEEEGIGKLLEVALEVVRGTGWTAREARSQQRRYVAPLRVGVSSHEMWRRHRQPLNEAEHGCLPTGIEVRVDRVPAGTRPATQD